MGRIISWLENVASNMSAQTDKLVDEMVKEGEQKRTKALADIEQTLAEAEASRKSKGGNVPDWLIDGMIAELKKTRIDLERK